MPKYALITAVVRVADDSPLDPEDISEVVSNFLEGLGLPLVPTAWAPDLGMLCDIALDGAVSPTDCFILDLNPSLTDENADEVGA
jgi:hypothetical protein